MNKRSKSKASSEDEDSQFMYGGKISAIDAQDAQNRLAKLHDIDLNNILNPMTDKHIESAVKRLDHNKLKFQVHY